MRLIIHLGIHKTASTFFQKKIFNNLTNYKYLSRDSLKEFKEYILNTDEFYFDEETAFNLYKSIDKSALNVIISDEDFYGLPFSGGTNRKRNLDRLLATFKERINLKFIVCLREQESLLNSLYLQYIKTGGVASTKRFLTSNKSPLFISITYFQYDKYLQYMASNIGEKFICCLFYEDFRVNKRSVINQIESFLETKYITKLQENKKSNYSVNYRFVGIIRFLNKFTKSYKTPDGLLPHIFSKAYTKFFLILSKGMKSSKTLVHFNSSDIETLKKSNSFLKKMKSKEWIIQNKYFHETKK